uniref:Phytocyanin domain-containing protein n=1 Tax=Salix viminalis TaxID=40686 RepID=A0A6N2MS24_SALVM
MPRTLCIIKLFHFSTINTSYFSEIFDHQRSNGSSACCWGSQGWEESTDFSSWASGQKFKVGDQLVRIRAAQRG